jgi:hypothetical protein
MFLLSRLDPGAGVEDEQPIPFLEFSRIFEKIYFFT